MPLSSVGVPRSTISPVHAASRSGGIQRCSDVNSASVIACAATDKCSAASEECDTVTRALNAGLSRLHCNERLTKCVADDYPRLSRDRLRMRVSACARSVVHKHLDCRKQQSLLNLNIKLDKPSVESYSMQCTQAMGAHRSCLTGTAYSAGARVICKLIASGSARCAADSGGAPGVRCLANWLAALLQPRSATSAEESEL